jgi:lectin, mannose-binding 2
MQSRWWDFGGSTVVRMGETQYVRLASQQPSQAGWIFSRVPLTATNWEIEVEFKIHGTGNLFGDGMAMWVTKDRAQMGNVFGMKDQFEGLGLFFDTYKNNRPGVVFPYVMAMIGDGETKYDQANDGKANELAGCSARGIRNTDFPTKAKVTYFQDKELTVELMYKKEDEWTKCFSVPSIKLPSVTYLGFSAETGELSDNFDIIKVDSKNLYSPTGSTNAAGSRDQSRRKGGKGAKTKAKTPSSSEGGSSWFWTLTKFLMFGLVVAGGYVGYTVYRSRRRDRF